MKDFTFLNIIHKVRISFSPSFTPKIGDLAENVRLEGPKKQAIVSCSKGYSLTFSAKSPILGVKGGENEIFTLCMMFRRVISFI